MNPYAPAPLPYTSPEFPSLDSTASVPTAEPYQTPVISAAISAAAPSPILMLDVLMDGDTRLREIAQDVTVFDDSLRNLAAAMFVTMRESKGCGLAAPQVGVSQRLIVIEYNGLRYTLVNPIFTVTKKRTFWSPEGCLSVPRKQWGPPAVRRHGIIDVGYADLDGDWHHQRFKNATAAIVQHEIDHLNGILFTDYRKN